MCGPSLTETSLCGSYLCYKLDLTSWSTVTLCKLNGVSAAGRPTCVDGWLAATCVFYGHVPVTAIMLEYVFVPHVGHAARFSMCYVDILMNPVSHT